MGGRHFNTVYRGLPFFGGQPLPRHMMPIRIARHCWLAEQDLLGDHYPRSGATRASRPKNMLGRTLKSSGRTHKSYRNLAHAPNPWLIEIAEFVHQPWRHRSGLDPYAGVIPRMPADQNADLFWNCGALAPP
jgi:hypothetical protein